MKKRILMSLFTIAIVGTLIGGGVMALFFDTETSGPNVFQAGTIDLTMGSPTITGANLSNLKPGDTVTGQIVVTNAGTLPGTLYGRTTYSIITSPNLSNMLDVISWQDPTMSSPINPGMTLNQLVAQAGQAVPPHGNWMPYGTLAPNATGTFDMIIQFRTGAPNTYQGARIDVSFEFLLTQ